MEKKSDKCVIITTINEPTEAIIKHIAINEYDVIIVGDKKTSNKYKELNCIYLDIEKQRELYPELADLIPYNHYCRKNIGYLYAIQQGYKVLYETDDDNIPLDNFSSLLELKETPFITEKSSKWINIFKYFTNNGHIWPRGYPLSLVKSTPNLDVISRDVKPSIICGLVENDPDVDSIFRLTSNEQIEWEKNKQVIISNENYCPFNTQNTFWIDETLFPTMMIPCSVSFRYCDILRGVIANAILKKEDKYLMFSSPNVIQKRNEHNLMSDFRSEVEMFLHNETIVDTLEEISLCYLIQAKDILPSIYECLRSKPHVLLSYKENTTDTDIFYPNSTLTTGRNKIREYVIEKKMKYDYYIFLDEDVKFIEVTQEEGFRQFEELLKKYNPIVATPNYVGYYQQSQKHLPTIEEAQNTVWLDGLCNAFSYEAFHSNLLFPYVDKFDTISWWASQYIMIALLYTYNREITVFNFLKIVSTQGSDYPKGDFTSQALEHVASITADNKNKRRDFKDDFLAKNEYKFRVVLPSVKNKTIQIYRKLLQKNIITYIDMDILYKWMEYFN